MKKKAKTLPQLVLVFVGDIASVKLRFDLFLPRSLEHMFENRSESRPQDRMTCTFAVENDLAHRLDVLTENVTLGTDSMKLINL